MNPQKRPYLKPELVQVPLRPDEAVLKNCKTAGGVGGPGGQNCGNNPGCLVDLS